MKRDHPIFYVHWASVGASFAMAAAIWARLLRGSSPWQAIVLILGGVVVALYHLTLATNWRGALESCEEDRARRVGATSQPRTKRLKTLRITNALGVVAGLAITTGGILLLGG